jgi:hypothetical protein
MPLLAPQRRLQRFRRVDAMSVGVVAGAPQDAGRQACVRIR